MKNAVLDYENKQNRNISTLRPQLTYGFCLCDKNSRPGNIKEKFSFCAVTLHPLYLSNQ